MNEQQLETLEHIRSAINDLYKILNGDFYQKQRGAKVKYKKVKPAELVEQHLEYIVNHLNQLRDGEI
mgnify:FL=1|tara:strand:+ start:312 stop:512 length:201 start_codon:yes stop_codon:yes gene_type:complete